MRQVIYLITILLFSISIRAQQSWSIAGNTGTKAGTNFLGTKDAQDLVFKTNSIEAGRIMTASNSWRFGVSNGFVNINANGELSFEGNGVYKVGANRYVFQTTGPSKFGLFFNSATTQFEFRNANSLPVFGINAVNGDGYVAGKLGIGTTPNYSLDVAGNLRVGIIGPDYATFDNNGSLSFSGNSTYKVGQNVYAMQDLHNPGVGLFANSNMNDWEFRDENASPFFTLNTKTQLVTSSGSFRVGIIGPDYAAFDNKGNLSFSGNATYNVADNIYAFQDLHKPGSGLFLNTNPRQWEFRDNQGLAYVSFNGDGRIVSFQGGCQFGDGSVHSAFDSKGNLRFSGSSGLRVSLDQYGMQCDAEPLEGLYMNGNPHQWEFRDEAGAPYMSFNVSTHDFSTKGGVKVGYSNAEVAGNIRWDGDGFQGFDGKSWKKFAMTDIVSPASTVKQNLQVAGSNDDLISEVNSLRSQIDELRSLVSSLQTQLVNKQSNSPATNLFSNSLLRQNQPNPFTSSTIINYNLPRSYSSAYIMITDQWGVTIKEITLSGTAKGSLNLSAYKLIPGTYQYTLILDGKVMESKQMVVVK